MDIRENQKELLSSGTGCLEKWLSYYTQRYLKDMWMWHLDAWLSGACGNVMLTVRLDDYTDLFQPKQFYDTIWRFLNILKYR